MSKIQGVPFAKVIGQLCSNSKSDILRTTIGDSLVVPARSRALCLAVFSKLQKEGTTFVITPTQEQAKSLALDAAQFLGEENVELQTAWETLPFERISPGIETMGHRCKVQMRLQSKERPQVVIASTRAAMQKMPDLGVEGDLILKKGQEFERDRLIEQLVKYGYSREFQVEARGEFSVRGSILDIYTSTSNHPVRIEFWGDEIERMSNFSIADQRSTSTCEELEIFPAREFIADEKVRSKAGELAEKYLWAQQQFEAIANGEIFDGMESFLPFLCEDKSGLLGFVKDNDHVLVCDPVEVNHRYQELLDEESSLAQSLALTWDASINDAPSLFTELEKEIQRAKSKTFWPSIASSPEIPTISGVGFDAPRGDNEELSKRLRNLATSEMLTVLVSESMAGVERMQSQLLEHGLVVDYFDEIDMQMANDSRVVSTTADIENGVICSTLGIAIITDHELSGHRHVRRSNRGSGKSLQAYDDLASGDYVVHHHHGVGVFEGLETKTMVGVTREYLILSFKGSDKLFVPSDQVGLVRKYIGSDKPALNRLGGADFEKSRSAVRKQVDLIAQELIVLYRKRINAKGFAFSPDNNWQKEFEDLFPYELTLDQKNTIDEVKKDMEQPFPMDRLVCGDVGFGKTEVALRAAFKATQDSKQVAVLVPTTLLATQHGQTFEERFTRFGLKVETISRFKTVKEQVKILDDLKSGVIDVIIGTHRLLSGDVAFKDLGLLIVDEEQRFGVNHKESIKKLAVNIDVLTLTATPIPRTLEMSLTGIRDMSTILTPPAERQPILTYVHEYDERAVAEAIRRELLREGQVFFIHNRVRDLEHVADRIRDLVPEARVVSAHGQMAESKLEKIVNDFYDHKHDVLIATTIVESGLDLPAVNTLIVDRADAMGLAQLYQLRGRVGRRGQRAYAYLFSPKNKALSHEAYERLKTIGEFSELGSGFKIAMRDLEIRGAGSLIGNVQSGHIAAVGFDMYCEMVTEAIDSLNGVEREEPTEVTIDISGDALIPEGFVSKQNHRFDIYRRLSSSQTIEEINSIAEELVDRFGPLPKELERLLDLTKLRIDCQSNSIASILTSRDRYRIVGRELEQSLQVRLKRLYPDAIYKSPHALGPAEIVVKLPGKSDPEIEIRQLIARLFE